MTTKGVPDTMGKRHRRSTPIKLITNLPDVLAAHIGSFTCQLDFVSYRQTCRHMRRVSMVMSNASPYRIVLRHLDISQSLPLAFTCLRPRYLDVGRHLSAPSVRQHLERLTALVGFSAILDSTRKPDWPRLAGPWSPSLQQLQLDIASQSDIDAALTSFPAIRRLDLGCGLCIFALIDTPIPLLRLTHLSIRTRAGPNMGRTWHNTALLTLLSGLPSLTHFETNYMTRASFLERLSRSAPLLQELKCERIESDIRDAPLSVLSWPSLLGVELRTAEVDDFKWFAGATALLRTTIGLCSAPPAQWRDTDFLVHRTTCWSTQLQVMDIGFTTRTWSAILRTLGDQRVYSRLCNLHTLHVYNWRSSSSKQNRLQILLPLATRLRTLHFHISTIAARKCLEPLRLFPALTDVTFSLTCIPPRTLWSNDASSPDGVRPLLPPLDSHTSLFPRTLHRLTVDKCHVPGLPLVSFTHAF